MMNIGAILIAGGSSLSSAIKTTIYLKDINDFAGINSIYS